MRSTAGLWRRREPGDVRGHPDRLTGHAVAGRGRARPGASHARPPVAAAASGSTSSSCCSSAVLLEDPAVGVARVADQLVRLEPQGELARRRFRARRRHGSGCGRYPAPGRREWCLGAALSGLVAPTLLRTIWTALVPSTHATTTGALVMYVEQARVEALALVLGVVPRGQLVRDLDQLEPDDLQSARFERRQDGSDQPALHAIGLDDDQSAFQSHAGSVPDGPNSIGPLLQA